jgi:outer membrane immunogenic protein
MKKLFLLASALVFATVSSFAADLSSRREPLLPPPPSQPMWAGFYVGLNTGGGWTQNNLVKFKQDQVYVADGPLRSLTVYNATITGSLSSASVSTNSNSSFVGGGQVGYNHQISRYSFIGLETDIQGFAGSGGSSRTYLQAFAYPYYAAIVQRTGTQAVINQFAVNRSIDYLGTVRGRIGYLITPTLAMYATGGLAYAGTSFGAYALQKVDNGATYGNGGPGGSSFSMTNVGWVAGGGIEWMFLGNWSAKMEYSYYDIGPRSLFMGSTVGIWRGVANIPGITPGQIISMSHYNANTHFMGNIVRAGVNYHFSSDVLAPLMAKF